jgi:hypothetical protein
MKANICTAHADYKLVEGIDNLDWALILRRELQCRDLVMSEIQTLHYY